MAGPRTRPATGEDALDIARIRAETWRSSYRGIVADEILDRIDADAWAERVRPALAAPAPDRVHIVAEDPAGKVVGFALAGKERGGDPDHEAEVFLIYVLPAHHRTGIGTALMRETARLLRDRWMRSMLLWTLRDNPQARRFYERLGGRYLREEFRDDLRAHEVAYGWADVGSLIEPT